MQHISDLFQVALALGVLFFCGVLLGLGLRLVFGDDPGALENHARNRRALRLLLKNNFGRGLTPAEDVEAARLMERGILTEGMTVSLKEKTKQRWLWMPFRVAFRGI